MDKTERRYREILGRFPTTEALGAEISRLMQKGEKVEAEEVRQAGLWGSETGIIPPGIQNRLYDRIRAAGMESRWLEEERERVGRQSDRYGAGLDDAARKAGLPDSRGWYDSALYLAKLEFLETMGA